MSFDSVNNAADGIGGNWTKFEEIGDEIELTLIDMVVRDRRDFITGEPMMSRRGAVRTEWIITGLAADGNTYKVALREGAQTAAATARKKSGADKFRPGGRLRVKYVADSKPDGAQFAFKQFEATYVPPAFETGDTADTLEDVL